MKKWLGLILAAACLLALAGCRETKMLIPPDAEQGAVWQETWAGSIAEVFTEGGGADLAEVVALELEDYGTMYFTITADTEFLRTDPETGEVEQIGKEELAVGAWAEIVCESDDHSGYHPILTITIT